mgnify:CR=1 FL=1
MAIEKIEFAIKQFTDPTKKRPFFKYVLVDLDDTSIIIDRLGRKIKKLLADA